MSPNHGRYAYSISSGGNFRVKEIGTSNILLDVNSENIIVADHAMSSDGLTLYLASDSTTAGGLWRFTRTNTSSQFSVPGVRVFSSPLRHVALYETGGIDQVFATYKSGANSWVYGFLTADSAGPSTAADWVTNAGANTSWLGAGVVLARMYGGTVEFADWFGAVAGRSITLELKPIGSTVTAFSQTAILGTGGAFQVVLPSGLADGLYDSYVDSTLFLRRKVGSVAIGSSGASGVPFVLQNGDVDDSGEVDAADIDAVIVAFGSTDPSINEDADGSQEVDAADIDLVIANFGGTDD